MYLFSYCNIAELYRIYKDLTKYLTFSPKAKGLNYYNNKTPLSTGSNSTLSLEITDYINRRNFVCTKPPEGKQEKPNYYLTGGKEQPPVLY